MAQTAKIVIWYSMAFKVKLLLQLFLDYLKSLSQSQGENY